MDGMKDLIMYIVAGGSLLGAVGIFTYVVYLALDEVRKCDNLIKEIEEERRKRIGWTE